MQSLNQVWMSSSANQQMIQQHNLFNRNQSSPYAYSTGIPSYGMNPYMLGVRMNYKEV